MENAGSNFDALLCWRAWFCSLPALSSPGPCHSARRGVIWRLVFEINRDRGRVISPVICNGECMFLPTCSLRVYPSSPHRSKKIKRQRRVSPYEWGRAGRGGAGRRYDPRSALAGAGQVYTLRICVVSKQSKDNCFKTKIST